MGAWAHHGFSLSSKHTSGSFEFVRTDVFAGSSGESLRFQRPRWPRGPGDGTGEAALGNSPKIAAFVDFLQKLPFVVNSLQNARTNQQLTSETTVDLQTFLHF